MRGWFRQHRFQRRRDAERQLERRAVQRVYSRRLFVAHVSVRIDQIVSVSLRSICMPGASDDRGLRATD